MRMSPVRRALPALALLILIACSREPAISDDAYRQAVTAFYTGLAALQTSQDVLARRELERVTELAPREAAGWANVGLLLLRQQQIDEGSQRLARASELAPENAHVERLLALSESLKGNLPGSIDRWRRAMQLDPSDVKAPFALAQELERQGGAENEAEAQRVIEALAARSGNLAAVIEYARLAAKRADAAALRKALDALGGRAQSWPADARQRLEAVREAAARGAAEAATPIIFLKNVLIRAPEYRAAQAEVTTPRSEVGEPLTRFVTLPNPAPQPAPADEQLTFSVDAEVAPALVGTAWAGVVWLTGEGSPVVGVANAREVRLASGPTLPFPGGASSAAPGLHGIVAADLNYDFRTDLVFAGAGGLKIFRQQDGAAFADVTAAAGLPGDLAGGPLHGVWTADVDTDGDLDLVVARQDGAPAWLRNNNDDTFDTRPMFAGVTRMRDLAWADLDGEGVPDAAVLEESGALRLFLNLRGGEFREREVPSAFPRAVAIAAAEISGDGILDVVGVTAEGGIVRLSQAANGTSWESVDVTRIDPPGALARGATRVIEADIDNNGAADLIVATRDASRVLLRGPDRTFRALPAALTIGVAAAADLNADGRLDLVGGTAEGARIARSQGQRQYRWQAIRPRAATATGDQRVNSFGIGGEVEVRTGLHAQKRAIEAPVVHFGLGDASRAEVVRIVWPNGVLQSEFDLAANAVVPASQRLKGSCPWLFAWNGREMSFVTDFIWRSPLGLAINSQSAADVLMTEDWVKVRGDQLVGRDGAYDLRITAELWETHFFDLVSLLVVDHPEGTEMFVDERFAVPPPRFVPVFTSPVQPFAAVRDDRGRDVSDIARARDDRHLDFAGRGAYQGVTRTHFVEVELPATAPRTGPLLLVGQGWVHPTDSSVNVALSQGNHERPAGLSLHVADARGRFNEVRTGLGFPSGKDKTVLLDLEGLFPATGPRRLRLQTNLEIFWDRLGWAVGRPDQRVEPRRIEMTSADLRYRGYSEVEQNDPSTPERPRYVLAGVAPRWRDLEGFHTRFGDVRELLAKVDDRYVIMNAGDEIRLTFPEAPPPAKGMVRDFILVGDGWVKDGDFNTVASRTVLPLPSHDAAQYDTRPGRLEDDPVYRRYPQDFERYHTRYVSPDGLRDALRSRIDWP
jgi:hypothetical protein